MDNVKQTDKLLATAADYRALLERALAPNRAVFEIVKAIQPPPYLATYDKLAKAIQVPPYIATSEEIARTMHPPAHLAALTQMATAMQRDHRLFTELARPPQIFDDLTKQNAQIRILSESITAPYQAFQEMMRSQSAVIEALSARVAKFDSNNFSIPLLSQTILAWNVASIGLANRMNDIGLLKRREMLSARMFEAPNVFAKFVSHTIERLAADPAPGIAARLRGSINLAKYQLLGIADAVSAFAAVPEDDEKPEEIRILDAPCKQQEELLSWEPFEDENDTAALTNASPTAQPVQKGRRVLELVAQCNEAGKTSAFGVEIFKPTTRLLTVFSDLPWLSATDRLQFADLVDCLYFIFYEGAGKDQLRYLDKNSGPLTEADCNFIWCIKHLRNKWTRHDADHGKYNEIKKSWAELAAKFRWLGLAEYPSAPHHFQYIHLQLLILAEDFLVKILRKFSLNK